MRQITGTMRHIAGPKFGWLLTSLILGAPPAALAGGGWSTAAPLPTPRQEIYAEVNGGLIYTLGGLADRAQSVLDDFLAYDPVRDEWRELTPMPEARHHITLAVADRRIYGIGGFTGGFPNWKPMDTVFVYDFDAGSWSETTPLPVARGEHISETVDGKIYVIGGRIGRTPAAATYQEHIDTVSVDVFDPQTAVWSKAADAPTARNSAASAVIDGRIYVVGGRHYDIEHDGGAVNVNLAVLEVFDPQTGTWETKAPMPRPSGGISAAVVNGKLLVFGGEQWTPTKLVIASAWLYDPAMDQWSPLPNLKTPRHGTAAAAVGERVFVFGGAVETGAGDVATNETLTVVAP